MRAPAVIIAATCFACAPSPRPGPPAEADVPPSSTFANPLDLDYRFMLEPPSWRQAADPLITLYRGDYYLFASRSGGYWYSPDMRDWALVVPEGLPIEDYAPAVLAVGGRLYYTAHKSKALFATDDPRGGRWTKVADLDSYADPALFQDDDGRVYLYYGSALNGGISAVELDPHNDWRVAGGPFELMKANHAEHGWERSGEDNLGAQMTEGFRIGPYVEGSWMTKHEGTYYLQYAAPGTVWKSYADGVYTSRAPTSGFTYAPYSPFSYKPGGFIGSAGHSGTFRDKAGSYWRVTTMDISVLHKFERRLGIFPAGFDADGVMRTDTYLGDYPQFFPGVVAAPLDHNRTGWTVVSAGKRATASSSLDGHPPEHAFDEDIRTQWSARGAGAGEWLRVDLGGVARIHALQVNLGEQGARALGRAGAEPARYLVEASADGQRWSVLMDRREATRDRPHAYLQLERPVGARYVRLTTVRAPAGGTTFAVRDLRLFGRGAGAPPAAVGSSFTVRRHADDDRSVTLAWERAAGATAYVVRYGLAPDKLYASYQVGDVASLTMNSLNRGVAYWFTVDALNENGVTPGGAPKRGRARARRRSRPRAPAAARGARAGASRPPTTRRATRSPRRPRAGASGSRRACRRRR
ncbi:MAG TPA: family 43 glycosylhydrolase [Gemmatimonadaceae bacterium]|nr:family 43 glycosylhydrolase [Gemmatimonadaceae bacterium]